MQVVELSGRRVVFVAADANERPLERLGALTSSASENLAHAARTALEMRVPLIGLIASSGADLTEGMAALHGWGLAAKALADCSGIVPVLLGVTGPAVSGPALLLGLADVVVMTEDSYAFVSGPTMVAEFTGVTIDASQLGGAAAHARFSGAAHLVVPGRDDATAALEQVLAYLPDNTDVEPDPWPTADDTERLVPEAGAALPATPTGSYDVRTVIRAIVDDGELLELRALVSEPRDGRCSYRRASGRARRQPTARDGGHARHPRLAEGRPLRRHVRRVQPAHHHSRRHSGLLSRQGPRVAGHDPPRRPVGVRVRARQCRESASSSARATAARTS